MARANVYLPDDLHNRARAAGLNVSELTQQAIARELERQDRLAAMDEFVADAASGLGTVSAPERAEAEAWAKAVTDASQRAARGDKSRSRAKKKAKAR